MTNTADILRVAEFGRISVSSDDRRLFGTDSVLERLRAGQVIDLLLGPSGSIEIAAKAYVGHAILEDGCELRIIEKHEGVVRHLLPWASPSSLLGVDVPSVSHDGSSLLAELCKRYLDAVAIYLQRDLVKCYKYDPKSLLSPKGRIDWRAQSRSASRGRFGRIACAPPLLSSDTTANALLGLALNVIDAFAPSAELTVESVAKARSLAAYFNPRSVRRIVRLPWRERGLCFERELCRRGAPTSLLTALAFGRPIALHALGIYSEASGFDLPCSFFLNVASLFEDAVVNCLRFCLADGELRRVTEVDRVFVLDGNTRHYRATPDFLVRLPDGGVAVGDCKYKVIDSLPSHSDVYQLIAHADAYNAKLALLVYPGEEFRAVEMGTTRSGIQCLFFCVDPRRLEEGTRLILTDLERRQV